MGKRKTTKATRDGALGGDEGLMVTLEGCLELASL